MPAVELSERQPASPLPRPARDEEAPHQKPAEAEQEASGGARCSPDRDSTVSLPSDADTPTPEKESRTRKQAGTVAHAYNQAPNYAKILDETLKQMAGLQRESAELHQKYVRRMEQLVKQTQGVILGRAEA